MPESVSHLVSPDDVPGFVCAYRFAADGTARKLTEQDIDPQLTSSADEWLWLHLNFIDQRCARWLARSGKLTALAIDFIEHVPAYQTIDSFERETVGSVAELRRDFTGETHEACRLHFLLADGLLVTLRAKPVRSAELIRRQLDAGRRFAGPAQLLLAFFSHYAQGIESVLHDLAAEIELIEDRVLDDRVSDERRRAVIVRREAAMLHRQQRSLRRVLMEAARGTPAFPADLTDLLDLHLHLDQEFEQIEHRARLFHDEIDAKLAAETNRQLYRLSVLTALFLPPAFVAGLFGMNLDGLPWTGVPHGFWLATATAILSSVATWLFLRYVDRG
ncbi:CorA family divalent cation transporter [Taklimakanibacter deserti]|uniref:CorA family divalent cation transporter n=1 Tax=Taklimakanibacter deserti TaxID=2267839 RepID=UPI000E659F50